MTAPIHLTVISRREFVLGTSAAAVLGAVLPVPAAGDEPHATWQERIAQVTGGVEPAQGKIALTLPDIAENGNTVPFSVTVDSPMTEADHVRTVHVFATGNPRPDVASFHFTPAAGIAAATSRMRLNGSQTVMAVAELSDGRFYIGTQGVRVTIAGCGG